MCGRLQYYKSYNQVPTLFELFGISEYLDRERSTLIPSMLPRGERVQNAGVLCYSYDEGEDTLWSYLQRFGWPLGDSVIQNARVETVYEKPLWRDALDRRRCLVVADSFWEQGTEFRRASGQPFAFAGLRNGRAHVAIITTPPNAVVAPVHTRMPAALQNFAIPHWLDPQLSGAKAAEYLEIYPSYELAVAA